MAICHEMNEGDVFFCKLCGLELEPVKTHVQCPFNAVGKI
jgi:hypothetical protein